MDNVERFWLKVDRSETCWLWTAGVGARGYGVFQLQGKTVSAHRIAYIWEVGPIPQGHQLDHLCGRKTCVRPDHMESVTSRVNTLRASHAPAAINAAKTHCWRGHPLTGPSADLYDYGDGRRICRPCILQNSKDRYARRKEGS